MNYEAPLNELQIDAAWQEKLVKRILAPVLRDYAYRNQVVFIDFGNEVAKLLQRHAHIDAIAQIPDGTLTIEIKIVRWPGYRYRHMVVETWSCTIPGSEQRGWIVTSCADVLLWCQCDQYEQSLRCWPFDLPALRLWFHYHQEEFQECLVRNPIEGRCLNTMIRKVPLKRVCREFRIEPFNVDSGGTIADILGKPLLRFLRNDEGVSA